MSIPFVPHPYQEKLIIFMIKNGAAGLLIDPGMGKTPTTYAAFSLLQKQKMVRRMLVIAPLRVANSVWPREAAKWDQFSHLKVGVLHGKNKEEILRDPTYDVHVINPEGLEWLFSTVGGKAFHFWDMLVVDESTKFKHTTTKRFKILKPFLNHFRRRYILTGSPAPNGLLDLFGQIYILDQGAALGRFITHYRNQFFDGTGYGGYTWVPREGAEERIYAAIAPLTVRLAALDYLDLEPYLTNNIDIDLPDDVRMVYDQMEALMLTEVKGELITAANAAAASSKCRQIANGGIYKNLDGDFEHLHTAKVEAVQDLVEELSGKPALIAYEFTHDLKRLQAAFPDAPYLGGGVTATTQARIEDDWNAGHLPVLLAQPQSVAHGLNLQGTGAAVVWHSLTWNLEHYEQFIRRVWRQGQRERVVVHHLVARNTVDEIILSTLSKKDRTQQDLLGALKQYAAARLERLEPGPAPAGAV